MPPAIRTRLQDRQKRHNMNTCMRGFITPYQIHEGRGSGELYVAPTNWRNNRALLDEDRVPLQRYTITRSRMILLSNVLVMSVVDLHYVNISY
jgi:hypothetical protein